MKISNSKKQLAEIIHENGGWRGDAKFSAQDKDGEVFGYCQKPIMGVSREVWGGVGCTGPWATHVDTVRNWHQTILSRDEYFHLYQAPVKVVVENKTTCNPTVSGEPTIEQLAADYRNAKDYADRKQQEADAAKADAEAKRAELVAAGKALGLVLSVTDTGPELVITDWRDLQLGDVIKAVPFNDERDTKFRGGWAGMNLGKEFAVFLLSENGISIDSGNPLNPQEETDRGLAFSFIRRPAKGGADA